MDDLKLLMFVGWDEVVRDCFGCNRKLVDLRMIWDKMFQIVSLERFCYICNVFFYIIVTLGKNAKIVWRSQFLYHLIPLIYFNRVSSYKLYQNGIRIFLNPPKIQLSSILSLIFPQISFSSFFFKSLALTPLPIIPAFNYAVTKKDTKRTNKKR